MEAKKQCILDFDNTLFDTKGLIRSLLEKGVVIPQIQAELGMLVSQAAPLKLDLARYVFPGVPEFIQHLRTNGWRVTLLSKGNSDWQEWKIRNSGIWDDVQNSFLVPDDKTDRLGQVIGALAGDVYFINDNWHETVRIRESHPGLNYLLKVRTDYEKFYSLEDVDIPYFRDFGELHVTDGGITIANR